MSSKKLLNKTKSRRSSLSDKKKLLVDLELIRERFRRYWKALITIILVYIVFYSFWRFILLQKATEKAVGSEWSDDDNVKWLLTSLVVLVQGGLYSLDGIITAKLKTPFGQMCFAVNKYEGFSEKKKDIIVNEITESSEHCKETFKKFGMLTMTTELVSFLIKITDDKSSEEKTSKFQSATIVGYFVPLSLAFWNIWKVNRILNKFRENLITNLAEKKWQNKLTPLKLT